MGPALEGVRVRGIGIDTPAEAFEGVRMRGMGLLEALEGVRMRAMLPGGPLGSEALEGVRMRGREFDGKGISFSLDSTDAVSASRRARGLDLGWKED
jgi:hypothetical protein